MQTEIAAVKRNRNSVVVEEAGATRCGFDRMNPAVESFSDFVADRRSKALQDSVEAVFRMRATFLMGSRRPGIAQAWLEAKNDQPATACVSCRKQRNDPCQFHARHVDSVLYRSAAGTTVLFSHRCSSLTAGSVETPSADHQRAAAVLDVQCGGL